MSTYTKLWTHITKNNALNLKRKEKHTSEFRRQTENAESGSLGSTYWKDRLTIGKEGLTGACLAEAVSRWGKLAGSGVALPKDLEHQGQCTYPRPGHTVQFYKTESGDVWYGVCCGDFQQATVFGEEGEACLIRWFDRSHDITRDGTTTTYYELLNVMQLQLLSSMEDWGDLFVYHGSSKLFTRRMDGESIGDDDQARTGAPNWYKDLVHSDETGQETMELEDYEVCRRLFPLEEIYLADGGGRRVPYEGRCSNSTTTNANCCKWTSYRQPSRFVKLPMITRDGPVFLQPDRYECKAHGGNFEATSTLKVFKPHDTNLPYIRVGDMKYRIEYALELQAMYADHQNIAAMRRRVIDTWLNRGLEIIWRLKIRHALIHLIAMC